MGANEPQKEQIVRVKLTLRLLEKQASVWITHEFWIIHLQNAVGTWIWIWMQDKMLSVYLYCSTGVPAGSLAREVHAEHTRAHDSLSDSPWGH